MFDSLTKSKFFTRCKSWIKMTRTRLEVLKNKKKAVAKYFKIDIADLLKTGLDYNAYVRAEGLLVELEVIARYDFIEQFCGCISSNLSAMNKQKECPEECKEAVQSLIYAAARFAEFPELRNLRYLFAQRYGTCLEMFVNKEFVEKLKPNPVTKDMKLQLMHDIAQEFSIQWSSKSLEQKLFQPQPAKQHSFSERESLAGDKTIDDGYNRRKSMNDVVSKRDGQDTHDDNSYKLKNGKEDAFTRRCSDDAASEITGMKEPVVQNRNEKELQSNGKKNDVVERSPPPPPGREYVDRPHLQTHSRDASEGTGETSWTGKTKSEPPVPHGGATFSEEPVTTGRARAISLQPHTLNRHVHPHLPDCDEIAAQIAALRGR